MYIAHLYLYVHGQHLKNSLARTFVFNSHRGVEFLEVDMTLLRESLVWHRFEMHDLILN